MVTTVVALLSPFCLLLLLGVAFDDILRDADPCSSLRHEEDDAKLDCLAIDAAD